MHSTADHKCLRCYVNLMTLDATNQNNHADLTFVGNDIAMQVATARSLLTVKYGRGRMNGQRKEKCLHHLPRCTGRGCSNAAGRQQNQSGLPSPPSWCCTLTTSPTFFSVIHLRDSKSVARRHSRQAPRYYEISGVGRDSYVRVRPSGPRKHLAWLGEFSTDWAEFHSI